MYTRSFFGDTQQPLVPENYDGVALKGINPQDAPPCENIGDESHNKSNSSEEKSEGVFASIFKNSPFGSLFSGGGFRGFKIGLEEVLILGVAAFLLFTKDGDKECAFMLLALLLIG